MFISRTEILPSTPLDFTWQDRFFEGFSSLILYFTIYGLFGYLLSAAKANNTNYFIHN